MNRLANKHVSRLGYPTGRNGALYYVADQEGLCQMAVDLAEFQLQLNGILMSSTEKIEITNSVKFGRDIYNSKIAQRGVPDEIVDLLRISKKSEASKYCNNMTLSEFNLYLFIQNSYLIGFTHESKFPEYIPEHLVISPTEKQRNGFPMAATKKLRALIQERRIINVHMFSRLEEWHCFYFSYDDLEDKKPNHWKHGCHIHYISYLWPNYTKQQVWDSFDVRKTVLTGNKHIRFTQFEYSDDITGNIYSPPNESNTPWAFAFDLALARYNGPQPTPSAQIATRGCWITKVSMG